MSRAMLVLVGVAFAILPMARPLRAEEPARLKISAALSLTGSGNFYGAPSLDGARLAVEEANAEPGQAPVTLEVADDESSPQKAADLAEKLGGGDATVVVGPSLTVAALKAGPAYAKAGLVSIVPTAHGDDVTNASTTFQPIFNTGRMGAALADLLFYNLQGRRAVVLFRNDPFGSLIAAGFRAGADRLGIEATYQGFSTDAERDEAAKTAILAPGTPPVVLAMLAADAVPLLISIRRAGLPSPVLAPSALAGDDFADLFAKEPEELGTRGYFTNDVYAASPYMFDSADANAIDFGKRFHARYGRNPSWTAVQGYDATRLAIAAARHVALHTGDSAPLPARRQAVRDFLLSLNGPDHALQGVMGPLWFTPTRTRDQSVRIGRFQDRLFESAPEQLVPVKSFDPAEIASGDVVTLSDGRKARRQKVVFTGVLLNEISRLDIAQSRFTADLYVWLRYPETLNRGSANPDDIEFPDLIRGSSDGKQAARSAVLEDGTRYRLWRIRGDFRNDFDLRRFPVDRQKLGVRFLNAHAGSDSVVYAQDRRAFVPAVSIASREFTAASEETFRDLPQWEPLRAAAGRATLVTHSALGNPKLVGLDQVRELSGFAIDVEVRRHVLTTLLKNLLPLGLMALIVYSTLHFPAHLLKEKVTVTVTGALSGAVLLSSINGQLGTVGYVMAVEFIFYAFFALCLLCIVSFVISESYRAAKRQAPLARVETYSRFVYMGCLIAVAVVSILVGLDWYGH